MTQGRTQEILTRTSLIKGFVFGILAGFAMIVFTVAMRVVWDALSITELAADWFTERLPGGAIDFLLANLSFSAKPLMFVGLLVCQVLVGGVLGIIYTSVDHRWPAVESGAWSRGFWFGVLLWLLSMVTLVPIFGGGVFGASVPAGSTRLVFASLGAFVVYGLTLAFFLVTAARGGLFATDDRSRRAFLQRTGIWVAAGAAGLYGLKFVGERVASQVSLSGSHRTKGVLSTEVTPNDEFYVVSKNIIDPAVDVDKWRLEVEGLVEEPFVLGYDEAKAMPSIEQFVTLECISNEVGGDLISNALWRGVPLRLFLERAGLKPGVVDVSFRAWDGYEESIPLDLAMEDRVIVAYEMNGEPLRPDHGFPMRLIVPGFFGIKHVKWLTAIKPVDYDFRGYWQERGWTDVPGVKTFSRFDIPRTRTEVLGSSVTLGGVAFTGVRGVSNVEVSADGGETWQPADRISEPLSPYTWVIWTKEFTPALRGELKLRVRATDGSGNVQTAERVDSIPDGASGHHQIRVEFPGGVASTG
ncbi:MAG: molybdopterin-dependent oxidoreductase [Chloroflexi bacterium]|nr:molybdopterin-dependent oxidoreductase [Chloroflexota bacterium]